MVLYTWRIYQLLLEIFMDNRLRFSPGPIFFFLSKLIKGLTMFVKFGINFHDTIPRNWIFKSAMALILSTSVFAPFEFTFLEVCFEIAVLQSFKDYFGILEVFRHCFADSITLSRSRSKVAGAECTQNCITVYSLLFTIAYPDVQLGSAWVFPLWITTLSLRGYSLIVNWIICHFLC